MDVREKLVELLTDNLPRCGNLPSWDNPLQLSCDEQVQRIADHLIWCIYCHTLDAASTAAERKSCKKAKTEYVQTNADRIRAMGDEELAELIRSMVDGSNNHNVACYGCINYGTHHSDPANKGTYLYECDGCENEGIGLDVLMWLQQPAEGE